LTFFDQSFLCFHYKISWKISKFITFKFFSFLLVWNILGS
jgi:hypothetical protein